MVCEFAARVAGAQGAFLSFLREAIPRIMQTTYLRACQSSV